MLAGMESKFISLKNVNNMAKTKFITPYGVEYESYEAYCNSPDLDTDIIQMKLRSGERKPQNEFEESVLKEILDARAEGYELEVYPE